MPMVELSIAVTSRGLDRAHVLLDDAMLLKGGPLRRLAEFAGARLPLVDVTDVRTGGMLIGFDVRPTVWLRALAWLGRMVGRGAA